MKGKKIFIIWATVALAALFSCSPNIHDPFPVAAPSIVSTSPSDGAQDIEGDKIDIVITYDQNIRCTLKNQALITVEGEKEGSKVDGASIEKVNAYMAELRVSVIGLESGVTYTLNVPDWIVEGFRKYQAAAESVKISFTTKKVEKPIDYELNPSKTLSNPNATPQAQALYELILSLGGDKILSGAQSEGTANNNEHINKIASVTGKHPALAGYDFIFLQYSPTPSDWSWVVNYSDMSAPIEHWNEGGVVSYMWHWNVPSSEQAWKDGIEKGNFDGYNFYSDKTPFSIVEALKEDTWQHEFIMKDMEKVAGYLKILADKGIPVIWRPLHEAAGNYDLYGIKHNAWFWWGKGGAEPCKQLYRLMRDTFEQKYGLNNLIWVWTLDATQEAQAQWADWYPGDEYVDFIGTDIYANDTEAKGRHYQACVNLGKGLKPVCISECGNIPDPAKCLGASQSWSWFMVWNSGTKDYPLNTDAYWKQIMSSSSSISREDLAKLRK